MKDLIVTTRQKAEVSDEQLYALKKEAYQQWADQGLEAEWLQESFEDFQKKIQKALVFVAIDPQTGELLGLHAFQKRRKGEHKYVFGFYLAVSPSVKKRGVATQLLQKETEILKTYACEYIVGNTAVNAPWSVKWHLKNGYRVIGYKRYKTDQFDSLIFRKQLAPSLLWSTPIVSPLFCRCRFFASYIVNRLRLLKTPSQQLSDAAAEAAAGETSAATAP